MQKLRSGDVSGVATPASSFVSLRGDVLEENPRITKDYQQKCIDICGLSEDPKKFEKDRYGHLSEADLEMLRWAVRRGSSSMSLLYTQLWSCGVYPIVVSHAVPCGVVCILARVISDTSQRKGFCPVEVSM